MCIRDHNAWLASNWFPIPRSRPRPTARNARSESGALYTPLQYFVPNCWGSKLNREQPGSAEITFSPRERGIIARPRGDFDACIGELDFSRSRVQRREDLSDGAFTQRSPPTKYVRSFDTISLSLSFLFLGLRPNFFYHFIADISVQMDDASDFNFDESCAWILEELCFEFSDRCFSVFI